MRLLAAAALTAAVLAAAPALADGFTFSGTEARGPGAGQVVNFRGKVSIEELTYRLKPYRVQVSDECDGFCIRVTSGNSELLQIFYNEQTRLITSIRSYDPGARDTAGNRFGGNFAKAVGAQPVKCDVGESTLCASKVVPGLFVMSSYSPSCDLKQEPGGKQMFRAPACVKIAGFAIERKR